LDIIEKYFKVKLNTINVLVEAIASNRIQYIDGVFIGRFNSKISREIKKLGGVFNKKAKAWQIELTKLPINVRAAIGNSAIALESLNQELDTFLKNFQFDDSLDFEKNYVQSITKIESDFRKTAKGIEVIPELTEKALKNIAINYSENMKLYIKDWTEENIINLRQKVQVNADQGFRAENLISDLQKNYGVSKNKAKFLAKQETSLLMSEYREQRYRDIGSTRYKWSTSKDGRVRPDHKELDGKIFSWSEPPIVNRENGKRAHPGQDFGCRCLAMAIID